MASVLERLRAELAREASPVRRYELQQQIDSLLADRPAPEGQEWVRNEAGEPELVHADTGEGKPWTPADRAAEEQRQAAERERLATFLGRPRRPRTTRPRVRGGRAVRPRPGSRRSPGRVRGSPSSDDPEPSESAAATLTRVAAGNIVVYARSRQAAVTLARVVMRAAQTYEGPRYG